MLRFAAEGMEIATTQGAEPTLLLTANMTQHHMTSTKSSRNRSRHDLLAVAHIDAYGKPQIIPNAESERITPSVILFDGASVIVGTLAKNNSVAEPEKIVDFVKREMGKPKEQFHREFDGKIYSAEELSALILQEAESRRGKISEGTGDRCRDHGSGLFQ